MTTTLPQIGTRGRYSFLTPLDTRIGTDTFTCIGVRTFSDVIRQGRDPFLLFYSPLGLSKQDYDTHLETNPHLVSLQRETGDVIVVPAAFIDTFPIMGGVAYEVMGLVVTLGALPVDLALTHVKAAVTDAVLATLGMNATVNVVKLSKTDYFTASEHANLEDARQAAIDTRLTPHARLLTAQARIQELESERASLIAFIEANP